MQVIQNIYLGLCENAALQLVSDTNLSILLPEYRYANRWVKGGGSATVPDPAFSPIESSPNYRGRCETCPCGIVACGANFCWKQDGELLLFLKPVAATSRLLSYSLGFSMATAWGLDNPAEPGALPKNIKRDSELHQLVYKCLGGGGGL